MYDMHSHFLPGIDDGAKNTDMSIKMLKTSMSTGVNHILSTSHCYPYKNTDIEDFIQDREQAYKALLEAAAENNFELPDIKLASEVHLTCDLTKFSSLEKLRIDGTDYILLEMPSSPWSEKIIDIVYKLTIKGFKPIIAHMDRNFNQNNELINSLYDLDILIQVNAESFSVSSMKKNIDMLMKNKLFHVIGSDMHNMDSRRPNMDIAKKALSKRYGKDCLDYIAAISKSIWNGDDIRYSSMRSFKKKGLFG